MLEMHALQRPYLRRCRTCRMRLDAPHVQNLWYVDGMNRNALACTLLFAACGGGPKSTPVTPELGTANHDMRPSGTPMPMPSKADPGFAFRMQYQDPGGMWMPSQMTLAQHVENFQKMGVKLDAKTLSDPLQDPLAAVVWLGGCTASFEI